MIQAGDRVFFYNSERMQYLVEIPPAGRMSTHRGHIDYTGVIGKEYGDVVRTHLGLPFHLLKPTLSDIQMRVRRTTTIVYPKDVGRMLLETIVHPGARVIETGSGSGALAVILANFVRPDGKVYSYERRPEFSSNARANVARAGLGEFCEFFVGDPEHDGYRQDNVDAVFLDVPEPWALMPAAHGALKGGHAMVSIVPTVEQVRKTVSAMEVGGFRRIRVRETLERSILVRPSGIRPADRMVAHTVYLIFAHKITREDEPPPAEE